MRPDLLVAPPRKNRIQQITVSTTGTPANISWWSSPPGNIQSMAAKTSCFSRGSNVPLPLRSRS